MLLVTAALAAIYLRWTPLAPDLAAQVARADIARHSGFTSWWTGWFGGLSTPSYSVLAPSWMALLGVRVTGVLATLVGAVATAILVRESRRPRAGAIAFAVTGVADLVNGRVTFVVGLAAAAWALVALKSHRPVATVVLALAAYFTSPLAGLFLGMILVASIIVDPSRRRQAMVAAGALLLTGGAMALLFPDSGTMPFTFTDTIPAALCCAGVALLCPYRIIRVTSIIVLLAIPAFLLVPGAVGDNITRLSWVAAVPTVVAFSPLPKRLLAGALVLLALWPLADLTRQLSHAQSASSQASFYQPLAAELRLQQSTAGPAAVGERLEVVDTANHWASVYLSSASLARGWDRQADNADNPIFYKNDALTATSYRTWLASLAVGWVAVPNAPLDYASVAEGKLIDNGLSYLKPTWVSADWTLYRVVDASPLASAGATVTAIKPGSVTLATSAEATVAVRLRWSPYLTMRDPVTGLAVAGCLTNNSGWVQLYVPAAETVKLTSQFDPARRLDSTSGNCVASVAEH